MEGRIYRTKNGFRYPLSKDRKGKYKVKSGEMIRVCMTSDFFLEEADPWRNEAWSVMRERKDVKFFLLTKRPERVSSCLPYDWGEGWENVFFNVTCENQRRQMRESRSCLSFHLSIRNYDSPADRPGRYR